MSLVAEEKDGTMVGFVMGEIYVGEYGISQEEATLDTLGVRKINTLVGWDGFKLTHFFSANQFSPSKTINLERII